MKEGGRNHVEYGGFKRQESHQNKERDFSHHSMLMTRNGSEVSETRNEMRMRREDGSEAGEEGLGEVEKNLHDCGKGAEMNKERGKEWV